jgi:hypothetical protein
MEIPLACKAPAQNGWSEALATGSGSVGTPARDGRQIWLFHVRHSTTLLVTTPHITHSVDCHAHTHTPAASPACVVPIPQWCAIRSTLGNRAACGKGRVTSKYAAGKASSGPFEYPYCS